MKYANEQLLLASNVRQIALDLWQMERNAKSDKWHAQHPGERRPIGEFAEELNKEKDMKAFVLEAIDELEFVAKIMFPTDGSPQS